MQGVFLHHLNRLGVRLSGSRIGLASHRFGAFGLDVIVALSVQTSKPVQTRKIGNDKLVTTKLGDV